MDAILNKKDIAKYLKVAEEEVDVLVANGMPYIELPGINEPERFQLSLIDPWLEKRAKKRKLKKQPAKMNYFLSQ